MKYLDLPVADVELTDIEADALWVIVDNWRESPQNRLTAVLALLNWMNETGDCPHPTGHRVVTELDVVWICAHVLATEVERTMKETP